MEINTNTIRVGECENPVPSILKSLERVPMEGVVLTPTLQEKWDIIRSVRNDLLGQTDWTQLADAPISEALKEDFIDYRQALRDLPQSFDTPEEVIIPELPSE